MSDNMKKGTILSLSLLLTSTLSVSTAIPAMTEYYAGRSVMEVEQLMSLPAIAIMLMIMLHPILSRWISQDVSIITGLLFLAISGIMPLLCQEYELVFISRMIHGAGIGLINVYAVTIINDKFYGSERAAMLGYRGAAETLGSMIFTFMAGQLLSLGLGWQYCFLIYVAAVPILILYLLFIKMERIPGGPKKHRSDEAPVFESHGSVPDPSFHNEDPLKAHISPAAGYINGYYVRALLFYGLCGAFIVGINCCNTIRIPSLVIDCGFGAETEASLIAGLKLGAGFLAGIAYWRFERRLKDCLPAVSLIALGLGELTISLSSDIFMLFVGAFIAGSSFSILTTSVFQSSAEYFPPLLSDKATTALLVGCNLGSGLASYILYLTDLINGSPRTSFLLFGGLFLLLGVFLIIKRLFWKTA